jgi:hypothetical protein
VTGTGKFLDIKQLVCFYGRDPTVFVCFAFAPYESGDPENTVQEPFVASSVHMVSDAESRFEELDWIRQGGFRSWKESFGMFEPCSAVIRMRFSVPIL